MENWASTSELSGALGQIGEVTQKTFDHLQNEAVKLANGNGRLSRRLSDVEARYTKAEPKTSLNETCQALTAGIEEQERLMERYESQLAIIQQDNDELEANIVRWNEENEKPRLLCNGYQEQSLANKFENEKVLGNIIKSLKNTSNKVDSCQNGINSLEVERQNVNKKVVILRERFNGHPHTSNYTYGNFSGSGAYSSGPKI